jgi:hypothetical protein
MLMRLEVNDDSGVVDDLFGFTRLHVNDDEGMVDDPSCFQNGE